MVTVCKVRKGTKLCFRCSQPATKTINGLPFCAHCGDGVLIRIIGTCVKAVEEAKINIKMTPKGIK